MITIGQFKTIFKNSIDPLDLEIIIADSIEKNREFVLAHPDFKLNKKREILIRKNIKRRLSNEPLAYILDYKEFFGINFLVNKDVLVPRPETELLVEEILKNIKGSDNIFIDLGTGSGNIIISLAKTLKKEKNFYGIDLSSKALIIAKKNSKKNNTSGKIKFLRGNLLEPIVKNIFLKNKNIYIAANLPYLDCHWKKLLKNKESAGLEFEPEIALAGGKDGLDLYRELAKQIKTLKNKKELGKIFLFCEINCKQKNEMKKIFSFAGKNSFKKDLAGKWRIFEAEI